MAKNRKTKTASDARHLLVVGLPVGVVLCVLIVGAVLQSGPAREPESPVTRIEEPPLPPPGTYEPEDWGDSALEENLLDAHDDAPVVEPTPTPPPETARREPPATPYADDGVSRLARRVMEDVDRLDGTGDDWTAQIGVYCDDRRVTDLVRTHGDDSNLFVLPVLLDDRACFRICWGHYTSHDRAAQARDLPAAFPGEKPLPRRISTVTE